MAAGAIRWNLLHSASITNINFFGVLFPLSCLHPTLQQDISPAGELHPLIAVAKSERRLPQGLLLNGSTPSPAEQKKMVCGLTMERKDTFDPKRSFILFFLQRAVDVELGRQLWDWLELAQSFKWEEEEVERFCNWYGSEEGTLFGDLGRQRENPVRPLPLAILLCVLFVWVDHDVIFLVNSLQKAHHMWHAAAQFLDTFSPSHNFLFYANGMPISRYQASPLHSLLDRVWRNENERLLSNQYEKLEEKRT